ncbi:UNVERIFIED_CONTAM: hypothetical protein Cloal_1285 [Acetivibrio alkalicellulosi]
MFQIFKLLINCIITPSQTITNSNCLDNYNKKNMNILIIILVTILSILTLVYYSTYSILSIQFLYAILFITPVLYLINKIIIAIYYLVFKKLIIQPNSFRNLERKLLPFVVILLIFSIIIFFINYYFYKSFAYLLHILVFAWFNIQVYRVMKNQSEKKYANAIMRKFSVIILIVISIISFQIVLNNINEKKEQAYSIREEVFEVSSYGYNILVQKMDSKEKVSEEERYYIIEKLKRHGLGTLSEDELELILAVNSMCYASINYFNYKENNNVEGMEEQLNIYENSKNTAMELLDKL